MATINQNHDKEFIAINNKLYDNPHTCKSKIICIGVDVLETLSNLKNANKKAM